jgi:hypothetical protein
MSEEGPGKKWRNCLKNHKPKRVDGTAHVVECPARKPETLSSNLGTTKREKKISSIYKHFAIV